MIYTRIIGTGAYFPKKILTNQDLMKIVDTSDEWIVERTGMSIRHIASKEETSTMMSYEASKQALEMAGIEASDIDGVIFSTIAPDYIMPVTAAMLSEKLGIKGPFAFDLNMACSGFLYALTIADSLIKTGQAKTILIAASDKIPSITDYTDRSTCILFGDAAGVVIVRGDSKPGVLSAELHADGTQGELLTMKGIGNVYHMNRDTMKIEDNLVKMNGNDTFKLAVRNMTEVSSNVLEKSGLKESDISYLVPHQANIRIIEAIAKRFNVSMDKVLLNIERRGNTGSATIPTVLDEGLRNGTLKEGNNILMTAFGGGMGWGAVAARL